MPVTSNRNQSLTFSGDVSGTTHLGAAANTASPGSVTFQNLSSGNNTITLPGGVSTVVSCTILPPSGNTTAITLRGVAGDTGFRLHNTDPCTITFASTVTDFVLNAGGAITGVRFYWS